MTSPNLRDKFPFGISAESKSPFRLLEPILASSRWLPLYEGGGNIVKAKFGLALVQNKNTLGLLFLEYPIGAAAAKFSGPNHSP
jgi:hypothetical protein